MKKSILIFIVIALAVGGGAFYGGMKYAGSKSPERFNNNNFQKFRNQTGGEISGSNITGEIIAKDAQSVTVKLLDGSSRIIFISESTNITKSVSASAEDLNNGEQIIATGAENPDGSYTAKTIRLSPRRLVQEK